MIENGRTPKTVRAERIADDYRAKGYRVVIEPGPDHLPTFLQDFRPDLIAQRENDNVVIEIRPDRARPTYPNHLREVAQRVNKVQGWRLEVHTAERRHDDGVLGAEPMETGSIHDALGESRKLIDLELPVSALLRSWGALESALRRILSDKEQESGKFLGSSELIRQAVIQGVVSRDDYQFLNEIARLRNSAAHGLQTRAIPSSSVSRLIELTAQLLDEESTENSLS